MNFKDFVAIIESGDMDKCKSVFNTHCLLTSITEVVKQYEPKQHTVTDKILRRDKEIRNDQGNVEAMVSVARLPLPIQKKIVLVSAAFLGLPTLEGTPEGEVQEKLFAGINKTWEDNKLDYKFKNIAKQTMALRECAEIWYQEKADSDYWTETGISSEFKWRMKILSAKTGDSLYPIFDEFGDMIAFGRLYKIKNIEGKEIEHLDIYTADKFYYAKKDSTGWLFANEDGIYSLGLKSIPNMVKKIPVIYYCQPLTEWDDVQPLIERLEAITSNHADTNDYSGSPIVVATGKIEGFAEKGEQGKVLQATDGAKVEYLTYDSAPESIRMEIENLIKYIYTFTHTPDISFEQMKGLGVFSGIALKMLFLDAHLKAADKEEIFGECLQRRINYLKAALITIDNTLKPAASIKLKPKFSYFLPQNVQEDISNLVQAVNAGIISTETAIKKNPLVEDAEAEIEAINSEQEQARINKTKQAVEIAKASGTGSPNKDQPA